MSSDSPSSIEIGAVDRSVWERELLARESLNRFHVGTETMEEVDAQEVISPSETFPFSLPTLREIINKGTEEGNEETSEDKDLFPQQLPPGLVMELSKIYGESRDLLTQMERIESAAKPSPSSTSSSSSFPSSSRSVSSSPSSLLLQSPHVSPSTRVYQARRDEFYQAQSQANKQTIHKNDISKKEETKDKPLQKRLQKLMHQPNDKLTRKRRSDNSKPEPVVKASNQSNKTPKGKPGMNKNVTKRATTTNKKATSDKTVVFPEQSQVPPKADERSESEKLRIELESLRHDLARLQSMSMVHNSLSNLSNETHQIMDSLPHMNQQITQMQVDTEKHATQLQRRIQSLIQSYRDISSIVAQSSHPFLFNSNSERRGMPSHSSKLSSKLYAADGQELYDLERLEEEMRTIQREKAVLETKFNASGLTGKRNTWHFERSLPQEDVSMEVERKVQARIQQIDEEVADFVQDLAAFERNRDDKGRRIRRRRTARDSVSAGKEHYLAPWMVPSKWSEQMARKESHVPPKVPSILKQAMEQQSHIVEIERSIAKRVLEQGKNADLVLLHKSHLTTMAGNVARPHYEKPLDRSVRENERPNSKGPEKNKARKKKVERETKEVNRKVVVEREDEEDEIASVDSITQFLEQLEDRRKDQEAFEANERFGILESNPVSSDKQVVQRQDEPGDEKVQEQKEQIEQEQGQEDVLDSLTERKELLLDRLSRLVKREGQPRHVALRAAFRTCFSILSQTNEFEPQELVNTCVTAMSSTFTSAFLVVQSSILKTVVEELILAQTQHLIDPRHVSQFLVLLDCKPFQQQHGMDQLEKLAAFVHTYALVNNSLVSDRVCQALLSTISTLQPQDKLSQLLDSIEAALEAAKAVQSSMLSRSTMQRITTAINACEAAFVAGAGFAPDASLVGSIQAVACLDTLVENVGEMELSSIQSAVCSWAMRKGAPLSSIEQVALRATTATIFETVRRVRDSLSWDERKWRRHSQRAEGIFASMDVVDLELARCTEADVASADKVFNAFAPTSSSQQGSLSMEELLKPDSLFAFCYAMVKDLIEEKTSPPDHISDPVRVRIALDLTLRETMAILNAGTVPAQGMLSEECKVLAFVKRLKSTLPQIPQESQQQKGREKTSASSPSENVLTVQGVQGTKQGELLESISRHFSHETVIETHPKDLPPANYDDIVSYLSSAVMAEMLVKEQNEALRNAFSEQPQEEDETAKDHEPVVNGGVVQWFVDEGEPMESQVIREATGAVVRDALQKNLPPLAHSKEEYTRLDDAGAWSDDNILELVTELFLHQLTIQDKETQKPLDQSPEPSNSNEEDKSSDEQRNLLVESAAAAALSAQLAAESVERTLARKELSLREREEDLQQKQDALNVLAVERAKELSALELSLKQQHVEALREMLRDKEKEFAKLEEMRASQLTSVIHQIGGTQEKTFTSAIEQIKDLIVHSVQLASKKERSEPDAVKISSSVQTDNVSSSQPEPLPGKATHDNNTTKQQPPPERQEQYEDERGREQGMQEGKVEPEEKEYNDDESILLDKTFEEEEPLNEAKLDVTLDESIGNLLEQKMRTIDEEEEESSDMQAPKEDDDEIDSLEVPKQTSWQQALDLQDEILHVRSTQVLEPKETRPVPAFTSTLLDWGESDDDSSDGSSHSGESRSLSEGQLDVSAGYFSDGEAVSLEVAYQTILKKTPPGHQPPWPFGQGPDAKLLQNTALTPAQLKELSAHLQQDEDLLDESDAESSYAVTPPTSDDEVS